MPNATVPAAAGGLPTPDHADAKDKARLDAATAEELAALDFQPWTHSPDEWRPPGDAEWAARGKDALPMVRMAWLTLFKTKDEMVKAMEALTSDEEAGERFMNSFIDTIDFFKGLLAVLEIAEARILCSGAVVELRDNAERRA